MLGDIFKGLGQLGQTEPKQSQFWDAEKPLSFSIYEQTPRHLLYIKDQIAGQKKKTNVLDDMFEGEALNLTSEEYEKSINSKMAPETAQKMAVETAQMDDSQFVDALNRMRQMVGMEPAAPKLPQLQQPNWQQSAVVALSAMLSPEHAFDIASVPLQHQLGEQQKQYAMDMQGYEQRLGQHNQLLKLAGVELERTGDNAVREYGADLQREQFAMSTNENREQAATQRNYGREMFLREVDFKFKAMDKENQSRLAFAYLGQALNPNSSAAERTEAAEVFNRLTGSDVKAFAGKTLAEQASELDMTLARNQDTRAGNADKRAEQLFPLQLEDAKLSNEASKIRNKYLPQQLQLDIAGARANIANVNDQIRSRRAGDDLALSEQERGYLGMTQDSVLGAMRGLGTQMESLGVEERALTKELDTADPVRAKEIKTRLTEIQSQKIEMGKESSELQGQLDSLNEVLKQKAGVTMGATNLGEAALGTPYSWGGGGAGGASKGIGKGANTVGFDCSGLTEWVAFNDFGAKIPGTAKAQFESKSLSDVTPGDLQNGDFLFYSKGGSWHVGILIVKDGKPYIRHAPQTGAVVRDDPLDKFEKSTSKTYMGARRVKRQDK